MDGEEGRDSDGRGLRRRRAPANLLTTTSRKALCFRIHAVVGPKRKTLRTRSPRRSAPCGIPVVFAARRKFESARFGAVRCEKRASNGYPPGKAPFRICPSCGERTGRAQWVRHELETVQGTSE